MNITANRRVCAMFPYGAEITALFRPKNLKSLPLPRGIEPLFSP